MLVTSNVDRSTGAVGAGMLTAAGGMEDVVVVGRLGGCAFQLVLIFLLDGAWEDEEGSRARFCLGEPAILCSSGMCMVKPWLRLPGLSAAVLLLRKKAVKGK